MTASAEVWGLAAAALSLLAHPITWRLARRNNNATAELTEAQAEQVRTEIWTHLQTSLRSELQRVRDDSESERQRAHDQIERMQRQLADVSTRLQTVELALVEKSAQLRATEIERDRLREEKAGLGAQVAAMSAQLAACRSCTLTTSPPDGR